MIKVPPVFTLMVYGKYFEKFARTNINVGILHTISHLQVYSSFFSAGIKPGSKCQKNIQPADENHLLNMRADLIIDNEYCTQQKAKER